MSNYLTIFRLDPDWQGVLQYDAFEERIKLVNRPPYDQADTQWQVRYIEDTDATLAEGWITEHYSLPTNKVMTRVLAAIAKDNTIHPVRNYLNSLTWDGTPRIDTWAMDYFSADDNELNQAIASKILIAAVARVMQPGCKVDTALVMYGPQGIGKSTFWELMATKPDWFNGSMSTADGKDSLVALRGRWIIELAELAALRKVEVERTKQFISQTSDTYRPPYGEYLQTFPRQNIFVDTTNSSEFLVDTTGNRRWWSLEVKTKCNFAKLKANREQLWAEAVHRYREGEKWYFQDEELETALNERNQGLMVADTWENSIVEYLYPKHIADGTLHVPFVTIGNILDKAFDLPEGKHSRSDQIRVQSVLNKLKWKRTREGKARTWGYKPENPITDYEAFHQAYCIKTGRNSADLEGHRTASQMYLAKFG